MNYKDINDYELIYMVRDGDDCYVEVLLDKYQPLIHRKTLRWKKVAKDCSLEIEDLEQEIRCSLVNAIRNFDDSNGVIFYTYVSTIIDNTIIRVLRNYQTFKQKMLNEAISLQTPIIEGAYTLQDVLKNSVETLDDILIYNHFERELSGFCYNLPIEDASLFELFLSGYSLNEIVHLLSLEKRFVSGRLYCIRKNLKKFLLQKENLMI